MLACCARGDDFDGEEVIGVDPIIASAPLALDDDPAIAIDDPTDVAWNDEGDVEGEEPAGEKHFFCEGACGRRGATGRPHCCHMCKLNPGLGFHDVSCSLADWDDSTARPVCGKGSRCPDRSDEHLEDQAHPLDNDYAICCAKAGVAGETLSLKLLFDWCDNDQSGKITGAELEVNLKKVMEIFPAVIPPMGPKSWRALDQDGNGVVNFEEWAAWAGPRVGLPVGLETRARKDGDHRCNVVNCPCEGFKGGGDTCAGCKHGKAKHRADHGVDVTLPAHWTVDRSAANARNVAAVEGDELNQFQELLSRTTMPVVGHHHVPVGYNVVRVMRNENVKEWGEYATAKQLLKDRIRNLGQFSRYTVQSDETFREVAGEKAAGVDTSMNEWYLLHGTSPELAQKICSSEFNIEGQLAGHNSALYGQGLYFAENMTKADMLAKPDKVGNFAVLLCRVTCGRVMYSDRPNPDKESCVNSCIEGGFDSVLGDRRGSDFVGQGAFRDFVLYDTESVYPEYIIEYSREYAPQEPEAPAKPVDEPAGQAEGAPTLAAMRSKTTSMATSKMTKIELLEHQLARSQEEHGKEHQKTISLMVNLAGALNAEKGYGRSIKLLKEAIALKEQLSGPDSPELIVAWQNLGDAYGETRKYSGQVEALKQVLALKEAKSGADSPGLAVTLANLGIALRRTNNAEEALPYVERGLKLKEAKFGPDAPEVALTVGNLAQVYGDLGKLEKQREMLMRALAIFEKVRGANHPHTRLARKAILELESKVDVAKSARDFEAKVIELTMENPASVCKLRSLPLGMNFDQKLPIIITKITPGGAAEQAGIAVGMRLVKINGKDVAKDLKTYKATWEELQKGMEILK